MSNGLSVFFASQKRAKYHELSTKVAIVSVSRVAFVPQNPLSSLTPHLRVGSQVAEAVRIHRRCGAEEARQATLELFAAVNLPDPAALYDRFPHELSGGQRQRVVISAALAESSFTSTPTGPVHC